MTEIESSRTRSELVRHLYVHVPFCPSICDFCSFEVLERRPGMVAPYLDRVERELAALEARSDVGPLTTVYIGGGTPSSLRADEITRLVTSIRQHLGTWEEMTLEVHPSTASADRFSLWSDLGVTRFSIGAQSFDDNVLRWLTRPHDAAASLRCIDWALATGVHVSVDLMIAIPGQRVAAEIDAAVSTGVGHVSAYVLTIEEGTPFDEVGIAPDELVELSAIRTVGHRLAAAGFDRYEVSNWSRSIGERCRHNEAYWANDWWAAVGPGASAHLPPSNTSGTEVDGADVAGIRTRSATMTSWLTGALASVDTSSALGAASESILTGLRRTAGVDLAAVEQRWGCVPVSAESPRVIAEVALGRLRVEGSRVVATPLGFEQLDAVTAALLVG